MPAAAQAAAPKTYAFAGGTLSVTLTTAGTVNLGCSAGNVADGGTSIDGGDGNDTIDGLTGDDVLTGGAGVNALDGGNSGTDTVVETSASQTLTATTWRDGTSTDPLSRMERASLTGSPVTTPSTPPPSQETPRSSAPPATTRSPAARVRKDFYLRAAGAPTGAR